MDSGRPASRTTFSPDRPQRVPRLPAPDDAPARRRARRAREAVRGTTRTRISFGARATSTRLRYLARLAAEGWRSPRSTSSGPRLGARRPRDRGGDPRRRRRRLPGRPRRRRLARARRLRRAPARRRLRGRRHEARAPREAAARAPALLLHRADRADPGPRARSAMHVVTGLGERETFRPDDFLAYYRRLRARFLAAVEHGAPTYPYPVEHCGLCDFLSLCKEQWDARRPPHARRRDLAAPGRAARPPPGSRRSRRSARPTPDTTVPRMRADDARGARHQAALQLHRRAHRRARVELLPRRARARLRAPARAVARATSGSTSRATPGSSRRAGSSTSSAGSSSTTTASRATTASGRTTAPARSAAFERLIDLIVERRRRFPGMHVYHYAPYERTALTRLMGEHGTREDELDDLLRGEVLVDLYRVDEAGAARVGPELLDQGGRGALRLRAHGRRRRRQRVGRRLRGVARDGRGRRSSTGSAPTTRRTAARSTSCTAGCSSCGRPSSRGGCRRRSASRARRRRSGSRSASACAPSCSPARRRASRAGSSPTCSSTTAARRSRSGGSTSTTCGLDEEELRRRRRHDRRPRARRRAGAGRSSRSSTRSRSRRRSTRSAARRVDPATEQELRRRGRRRARDAHAPARRRARGRAAAARADPAEPLPTWTQRDAVLRFAQGARSATRRSSRSSSGGRRGRGSTARSTEAALSLDGSYLFVQGPPGSGKTWNGARMAIALMRAGQRVGVTSLSHKAIHKFLEDVEEAARRGRLRVPRAEEVRAATETRYEGALRRQHRLERATCSTPSCSSSPGRRSCSRARSSTGTSTRCSSTRAGQFSLADALAVGTAGAERHPARRPEPARRRSRRASHPPGANASVLEHLLGEDETRAAGHGRLPRADVAACGRR